MIGALGNLPCGWQRNCLVLLSGAAGGINYGKAPAHPLKFNGTFSGRNALTYQTLSLGVKY